MNDSTRQINWKGKTFLIADDDYYSYLFLESMITQKKGEAIYAKNGADAVLHCLNRRNLVIALIDLFMPKLNGFEVMKIIKNYRPAIICIAQTAYGFASEKKKTITAGFDAYILKPITMDKFYSTIQICMQNRNEFISGNGKKNYR